MSALLWALVVVPLVTGAVLCCGGRRTGRAAPACGVAAALVVLGLAVASAALRPVADAPLFAGIRAGLAVDGLSSVMVVTVAAVTAAVLVFSTGDVGPEENRGRFFGLMLVFAGAMLVTVTATTLPPLLMAWEAMGATSWALIGYWWRDPQRVRAADTAFLTTRTADLGLYLAAGAALAGGAASLRLDALATSRDPWLQVVAAGVVAAALGKSAQLPFSFWLSGAMRGPSPVSALLHSAAMVAAGAYLLLRLGPLLSATGWGSPVVSWVGAVTAVLMGLVAVAQTDVKQLLAASTCAQVGLMVLAAGAGATAAGTAHLVAHAAVKAGLFLAAGAWLAALGTTRLGALRGAVFRHPVVGAAFAVGALALAGLPPLSLWATKDAVLAAVLVRDPVLYAVGSAAGAVSAVYSAKALWYVATGRSSEGRGSGRVPPVMLPPLVVLAAGAAVLGVLVLPGGRDALRSAVGAVGEPVPHAAEAVLSGAVAVVAAGLTWWWHGRRAAVGARGGAHRPGPFGGSPPPGGRGSRRGGRPGPAGAAARLAAWPAAWWGAERAVHAVLVRPVVALARALAAFDDRLLDAGVRGAARGGLAAARRSGRFDDRAVDGTVRGAARGGLAAARWSARCDDGGVDAAVRALASGARRLGRLARRPQTGLLHQYYAQAAVCFVVLTVFLLLVG